MRFLADMGIGLEVISALRAEGHDAFHLTERGLKRLADDKILELAAAEVRIVLAHDLDMGRLLAISAATAPSVISFRLSDMRPANVLRHLRHTIVAFLPELEQGAVVSVTDSAARCHMLPLRSSK